MSGETTATGEAGRYATSARYRGAGPTASGVARGGLVRTALCVVGAAALLLWPALLNGYPIVFGDTGVYLADGQFFHGSWARPIFYGLFMRALDFRTTLWPVIAAQCLITAALLHLTLRSFVPGLPAWVLIPVTALLSLCTSLPWFAAMLMPDLFGPLMVLALALLILKPEHLSPLLRLVLVLFAAGCITTHQSFLPTAIVAVAGLLLVRAWLGQAVRLAQVLPGVAVLALALGAATAGNLVLMGQASPSPYGKLFILARVIMDGPGRRALERECPRPDWSLCAGASSIAPTVEEFLFGGPGEGSVNDAGGYKVVGPQAWPVVLSALRAEPAAILLKAAADVGRQFVSFATGDGLHLVLNYEASAWESTLPPAEVARFKAAKRQHKIPLVPGWLQVLHQATGFLGLAALAGGIALSWRRRDAVLGLCWVTMAALLTNAAIAGALSGVWDRYQSRFMMLPALVLILLLLSQWRGSAAPGRGPA